MFRQKENEPVDQNELEQMLAAIRHRGPDEFGMYIDAQVGLGSARLSIIDLESGQQPISNQDESLWIVFNGEIFNYLELRKELEGLGHQFQTQSDTEVLLHVFEEFGPPGLNRLNGQFAFAIWNSSERSLFLARDRLGVRPLFYQISGGRLCFASEIKALLPQPHLHLEIDPAVLSEVFTFWAPLSPRTIFKGVFEIPPGHYLIAKQGAVTVEPYWQITFAPPVISNGQVEDYLEQFSALLSDATKIRLRADVPVGAYLSGGLDSSTLAAIVHQSTTSRLSTFSIAFKDTQYDESHFQNVMAGFLGTEHHAVTIDHNDIARIFPEVVWHLEVPVMRTSPAPMFVLSKLVRDAGFKVVLTGEGADEFLAGYDIFKETKIRQFCARQPESHSRHKLFQKLYEDIPSLANCAGSFRNSFFTRDLTGNNQLCRSHLLRWQNNRRTCRFFSNNIRQHMTAIPPAQIEEQLQMRGGKWTPLARAQFLEITIFLSQYLLSSQGDRMSMAHSIEGRFPFLDYRVTSFCNTLPENLKLRRLAEKYLLKLLARRWLPPEILRRRKRPYRAPIHHCFFGKSAPEYVRDLLSFRQLKITGYFEPSAVGQLVNKVQAGGPISETDQMALVGIISTQLLHHLFIAKPEKPKSLRHSDSVNIHYGNRKPSLASIDL